MQPENNKEFRLLVKKKTNVASTEGSRMSIFTFNVIQCVFVSVSYDS